ncbi:TorD/DmsD family molecular chaperone [Brevibacillus ginsengisoli]|uniref:TorD/DmsD family molecular chaperone n=1 Tax=Brevibacillus ginsengisoli TaxID=363854 RepID=UPI003CF11487
MKKEAAKLLSNWWTSPDQMFIEHWLTPGRWGSVIELWHELDLPKIHLVMNLYVALTEESDQIRQEYERLFVGPGRVPCPPYEAVWQLERPRHEEGMVTGEATDAVSRLYASMGLHAQPGCPEFLDHVAIELEALAHAWSGRAGFMDAHHLLENHLAKWIPLFCESVVEDTKLDFYRILAVLTMESVQSWAEQSRLEVEGLFT